MYMYYQHAYVAGKYLPAGTCWLIEYSLINSTLLELSLLLKGISALITRTLSESFFIFAAEGINFTRSTTRITGEYPVAPKGDEGKLQVVITLLQCTGKLHTIVTLFQYTGMLQAIFYNITAYK